MASDDAGKLVLRLTLGILLLFHGIAKIQHGVDGIEGLIAARGLPQAAAWAVYVGEFVAPLFLIVGAYTRLAGVIIAINMVVAVMLVHQPHILAIGTTGGWRLELQAFYLFSGIAVALLGAGRYAIQRTGSRWN